jgi:hypothetical protein
MAVWYVPIITPLPFDAALRRRLRKEQRRRARQRSGFRRRRWNAVSPALHLPSALAERTNRASSYGD